MQNVYNMQYLKHFNFDPCKGSGFRKYFISSLNLSKAQFRVTARCSPSSWDHHFSQLSRARSSRHGSNWLNASHSKPSFPKLLTPYPANVCKRRSLGIVTACKRLIRIYKYWKVLVSSLKHRKVQSISLFDRYELPALCPKCLWKTI